MRPSKVRKFVTASNVKIVILFIPFLYLLISKVVAGKWDLESFLDTSILTSFLLAFICEAIASVVSRWLGRKYEDVSKLTEDYELLVKKYSREKLIDYQGHKFPVIQLASRKLYEAPFEICLNGTKSNEKYELPSLIKESSNQLMKAHKHSIVYNNMNVRADDIQQEGNKVTISYSKTTYFDSLITNRAMDYEMDNGKTIREIYEPGPFLSRLWESKLSNHLGFNGFIETTDNKFIFVIRASNLSIGKNTLANSIGASLKVEYCLNDNRELTLEGLSNGIRKEIEDELKIKIDEKERLDKSIFAFYRDIVEGGKPQFLFFYKLNNMTGDEFLKNFEDNDSKEKRGKKTGTVDGNEFLLITLQELKRCEVWPGELVLADKRRYKMMPSAAASIVLLEKALQ